VKLGEQTLRDPCIHGKGNNNEPKRNGFEDMNAVELVKNGGLVVGASTVINLHFLENSVLQLEKPIHECCTGK
jgi:hypothetical protein